MTLRECYLFLARDIRSTPRARHPLRSEKKIKKLGKSLEELGIWYIFAPSIKSSCLRVDSPTEL